jgi:predicted ferric reductase
VSDHPWWYVARSTGLVSWGLLAGSTLFGIAMVSRRGRSIPGRLSIHRVLSGLGVLFAIAHVVALMLDGFVDIGFAEALVPFASVWRPGPVAWGVGGLYVLLLVQVSSLLQRHMSRARWRRLHVNAYVMFGMVTIHFLSTGSDVTRWVPHVVGWILGVATIVAVAWGHQMAQRRVEPPTEVDAAN